MNHIHILTTLLLLVLALPASNPFIPSHQTSPPAIERASFPSSSFPFYASDKNKRQRKISVNVDVSIRKAVQGSEDDDGSNAAGAAHSAGNEDREEPSPKRRRKRDILADSLSSLLTNPNKLPSLRRDTYDLWNEQVAFRRPGEKLEMPDFLSAEEERELNATYDGIREERTRAAEAEFRTGVYGPNVTLEEAKRIVDYVIGVEREKERDKLNELKSIQVLKQYKAEAARLEEEMVADILSEGPDKILDRDPIAREIVTDLLEEKEEDAELKRKIDELTSYKLKLMEREQDVAVEAARAILEKNPDPDIDMIDVYNEVVARIQEDRRTKLSAPTLGVLGDTIDLEEAKEYGIRAREEADRDRMAREEAVEKGWCDADGVDAFFEEPTEYVEVKMFQSIVRSIVLNRPAEAADDEVEAEARPSVETEKRSEAVKADKDGNDVGNEEGSEAGVYFYYGRPLEDRLKELEAEEKKWTLSASEKAEAFKLFNDWREFEKQRKQAELELEPEERPTKQIGLNARANPLFLYTEDSDRTRQYEQKKLEKALRRQLQAKADDDIEKSSNELLMKELLEGGYTKERSLRLIDKLISKSDDKVIKDALMDIKTSLLESKDEDEFKKEETPKRPLFVNSEVDLSKVFIREEDDERKIPMPPKPEVRAKTMPPVESDDQKWRTRKIEVPMDEDDDDDLPDLDSIVEQPKTAFFESFDRDAESSREKTTSELFGSYDDQSFERFAARTGAKTEEEKAELRRNLAELEELKAKGRADIEARDVASESARLGIDMDTLNVEDLDLDPIQALLSKRSAIKPKDAEQKTGTETAPQITEKKHEIIAGPDGTLKEMETGEADYITQAYRAISGGDTDDEDEYRDFLKFQEEGLKKLEAEPVEVPDDIDIEKYADETLSEMKSFAALRDVEEGKKKIEAAFEGDAVYTEENEDEYGAEFDIADDDQPSWLSLEQRDQGTARKESSSYARFDSAEYHQQIEERQKMADEFLKQQSGGVVDIAEVLDRPYFGSMDAPDDYTKKRTIFSSYEARKDELMQYTTLRLEDIINFVDWKRDPASTGVNQYLMEVQRPFSEYGALFRLEGCIVELLGMQAKAWEKVAEKFGYMIQSEEQIRKASLYAPAKAIRMVFGWTDDVLEIEQVVKTHHSELNAAFNDWLEHDRTFVYPRDPTRRNNSGLQKAGPSKDEVYETYTLAWNKLAHGKGKTPPTKDQVVSGIKTRDWEVAVPNIFGWNEYSSEEIYDIVVEYDAILQVEMEMLNQKYSGSEEAAAGRTPAANTAERPKPSKDEINTVYSLAWNKMARDIGQAPPTKEQVMQGLKLRDWEVAVKDVFGWEYSANKIYEIIVEYDKILQEDFKTLNKNYGLDYGYEDRNKYPDVIMHEGVMEWLDKLRSVDMKFAVMSHLGRSQLDAILDVTGLADYFPPDMRVTLDERYSDERSELLGGALRVEKLPERCVVFDNTPSAAVEAHEVLMKCVSIVDQYAKYELLASDWTIGGYRTLDISSIRSLFSIRDDNVPLAVAEARGDLDRLPPRAKTGYQWDEGDR